MKSYYCFIPVTGSLDAKSKVFRVAIGISERDQIKRQLLDLYACDCGFFFRIWDSTTDFELKCRMSQSPDARFLVGRGLTIVDVSITKLYSAIIDGTLDSIQNPPHVIRNYFRLNATLSPRFFLNNVSKKKVTLRANSTRKNLSIRPSSEDHVAAIGFGCICLLYWLGSILELWESSL